MYQTISRTDFHDAFRNYNREANFSYEGRNALFDYLEDYEESCGEKVALDVIALCCDYCEDTIANVLKEHDLESLDELNDETLVIWHDDERVLYQAF